MSQLLKENHEFLPEKKELSAAEEKALQAKSLQEVSGYFRSFVLFCDEF